MLQSRTICAIITAENTRTIVEGGNFTLEHGSTVMEKEDTEMMNVQEVARMFEYLRAKGLTDTEIAGCVTYIATGIGLNTNEPDKKETN